MMQSLYSKYALTGPTKTEPNRFGLALIFFISRDLKYNDRILSLPEKNIFFAIIPIEIFVPKKCRAVVSDFYAAGLNVLKPSKRPVEVRIAFHAKTNDKFWLSLGTRTVNRFRR